MKGYNFIVIVSNKQAIKHTVQRMCVIPEHMLPFLSATYKSAYAQLPQGYDASVKKPGFNNIREQRRHAEKMLQMHKHLGTEAVMHWERVSKTLKMIDFIDE